MSKHSIKWGFLFGYREDEGRLVPLCSSSKGTLLWSPNPLGLPETLKATGQMQQRSDVSLQQLREAYHHSNFLSWKNKWILPHTATPKPWACVSVITMSPVTESVFPSNAILF